MRVSVLNENTSLDDRFLSQHGISMHIDTGTHQILFDMGASDIFMLNADILGVDISRVEVAVVSHGHNDHGGGLQYFLRANQSAKIYMHIGSFDEHYSKKTDTFYADIGMDKALENDARIVLLDDDYRLYDDVCIMSNIAHRYPLPLTNSNLYTRVDGTYILDDFSHEQDLVVRVDSGYALFVGCAHNGIKNILEHFRAKYGTMPRYVLGGLHLSSRTGTRESDETIDALGHYLHSTGAMYYTCHCTGDVAYKRLSDIMGASIRYVHAGSVIDIE